MKRILGPKPDDEETQSGSPTSTPSPAAAEKPLTERRTPREKQTIPPEFMEILLPSLKVGATAGACGLFTGAAAGIIRSAPTVFFSVIAGGQWFTLGTSYNAARLVGLKHFGQGDPTPGDKVKASTVAGGVAGSLGGLLRGPRNVIPGAVVFSLLGAGGQAVVNWRDARAANAPQATPKPSSGFWAKWNPLKRLSDQDYVDILEERLLRVEVDIALMDDRIRDLRESESQKREEGVEKAQSNPSPSSEA